MDKTYYLHSGAVLWTHNNTIEFVILRNDHAQFKTVGIELGDEKLLLEKIFSTQEKRSVIIFYKFGDQAQLVIWDLFTNSEISNFAPKEGVDDIQIINGAGSAFGYLLGDKRVVNLERGIPDYFFKRGDLRVYN